jgi:drug/metabolite transporter (DMT)-like permease
MLLFSSQEIAEMVGFLFGSGLAVMTLAAFLFALTDVIVKLVSPSIGAVEIAFFRFAIGGTVLLPYMLSRKISLRGNQTYLLVLRGVIGFFAFFFLLKSIAMIPLANAMVLFYTFPVFATFFSFLVLRESVGKWEILLIAVGLIGIYVLLDPGSHAHNMGDMFGLLGGCFAGLAVALIRKVRQTNGALIIYLYYCLVGGTVCFPFLVKDFQIPSSHQFILLMLLGFLFLAAQLLMIQGFTLCKVSEGSVILMSELVFAGIAGVFVFREPLSQGFFLGALLVLVSGVGLNLVQRRHRRSMLSQKGGKAPTGLP